MARATYVVPEINLVMHPIPAGTFLMGSPESEKGRYSGETQHQVTLTEHFLLGKYPVTQAQWKAVMGTTVLEQFEEAWNCSEKTIGEKTLKEFYANGREFPERLTKGNTGANRPMFWVNYEEALEFCKRLTEWRRGAGTLPDYAAFTLPTEAQWEYACRAGTTGAFGGIGNLDAMGWYEKNSGSGLHDVGEKKPNAWELHDMHGNVWEWCLDWYGAYPTGAVTDPRGATTGGRRVRRGGGRRVRRGGGWSDSAQFCRSAFRGGLVPARRNFNLGFRVALSSA